jgi:hypothetical protein
MGMIGFICIIVFSIIWPVEMLVLKVCSGDVRAARCVLEVEGSVCLNRTSGKIQPHSRHLHSQIVGRTLLSGITLHLIALSQAVKTRATFYTPGSDMISFRDTFNPWGLIMTPLKPQ